MSTFPASAPETTSPAATPQTRVLIFTNVFAPEIGGAGMVPEALARAFPDRIAVVAAKAPPADAPATGYAAFDARFPFRVFRVSAFQGTVRWRPGKVRGLLNLLYNTLWVRPAASRQLLRLLASEPFDVACLNTTPSCYWLPTVLRRINPRVKILSYAHGEEWGDIMATNAGRRTFRATAQADAIVAVSSFTRDRIIAAGIPERKLHLVHNGVDLTRFSPGPPSPHLLEHLGVAGRPNILCLARLDRRKGQDALIRALPAIHQHMPNAVLILVGSGADEARLRALVAELHLEHSVLFTGTVSDEDVVAWYRTADLYAMPNRTMEDGDTEGFGLVFLEAGACGLAVIGGRAGGVPDAVRDGETGLLVDGDNIPELAAACLRLLTDPALRSSMGRNGITHAATLSWPTQAAKFLRICDTLAAPHPTSPAAVP